MCFIHIHVISSILQLGEVEQSERDFCLHESVYLLLGHSAYIYVPERIKRTLMLCDSEFEF